MTTICVKPVGGSHRVHIFENHKLTARLYFGVDWSRIYCAQAHLESGVDRWFDCHICTLPDGLWVNCTEFTGLIGAILPGHCHHIVHVVNGRIASDIIISHGDERGNVIYSHLGEADPVAHWEHAAITKG